MLRNGCKILRCTCRWCTSTSPVPDNYPRSAPKVLFAFLPRNVCRPHPVPTWGDTENLLHGGADPLEWPARQSRANSAVSVLYKFFTGVHVFTCLHGSALRITLNGYFKCKSCDSSSLLASRYELATCMPRRRASRVAFALLIPTVGMSCPRFCGMWCCRPVKSWLKASMWSFVYGSQSATDYFRDLSAM